MNIFVILFDCVSHCGRGVKPFFSGW